MFKKSIVLFLLIYLGNCLYAQDIKYRRINKEFYDQSLIHFGFLFGFPSYNLFNNEISPNTKNPYILESPKRLGLQIGGTVTYTFNPHWDLKTGLNVALYDRTLNYYADPTNPTMKDISSSNAFTGIEIPIFVKFKSLRRYNNRAYMLAGLKYTKSVNLKKSSYTLDLKGYDFSLEYGIGFDQFFRFFKLSPELRFSQGFINIFNKTNPPLPIPIQPKLNSNSVALILNFE